MLLLDWKALPPDGNLTPFSQHFTVYHDIEVTAYQGHNLPTHEALAVAMLYCTTIRTMSYSDMEFSSFCQGFHLPCWNGFDFIHLSCVDRPGLLQCSKTSRLCSGSRGGTKSFLSQVWVSHITSIDSLLPALIHLYTARLRVSSCNLNLTFNNLLETYLCGSGIPCPQLFEATHGAFHCICDLSHIDSSHFWAQILVWAVSGSLLFNSTTQSLSVGPIAVQELGYGTTNTCELFATNGMFLFRTCMAHVRYPVDYLLTLAAATYNPTSKPPSFQATFDHSSFASVFLASASTTRSRQTCAAFLIPLSFHCVFVLLHLTTLSYMLY
ncbi:hypothetical protein C8J57DRAFT_1532485 [Mycena rebaudengoi]|nr:hypothetical protein C8J57DRAFT_1532485 [Mycena rebaudengoi]